MDHSAANVAAAGDRRSAPALLVLSHLRWHFVTQRPQHLMVRAAASRPVFFWEEPFAYEEHQVPVGLPAEGCLEAIQVSESSGVVVLRPHLRASNDQEAAQQRLLDEFLRQQHLQRFDLWVYTPMAMGFAEKLKPDVTVYDAMDELSAFAGASPQMLEREAALFRKADVVFTGGHSLWESKRTRHGRVLAFPSSVDVPHFAQALAPQAEPEDQAAIPHPRVGFFGVLDERFDRDLIAEVARLRPDIHFVLLGPVVKVEESAFPRATNLHYLGGKGYPQLPSYLAGWDAAMLPFALNEATRFISPTKTPEYLAAGKRVVSTPIRDVVRDYGATGLVAIADTAGAFADALDQALGAQDDVAWKETVQLKLASGSWDATWAAMAREMEAVRSAKRTVRAITPESGSAPEALHASADPDQFDYLVVGAGFAGAVVAEQLAAAQGKRVLVIDKRPHLAGNAFDCVNEHGILVHQYGPHIFHTQSEKVFSYLSRFTAWRPYEHRVLAEVDGRLVPLPINIDTLEALYGVSLDAESMERFLAVRAEPRAVIRSSEDIVVARIGRELYEKFFQRYTRKQWGMDPSELDASVAGRIPVRCNRDNRYFSDAFQAMPSDGYTRMFERMLAHPRITVRLGVDFRELKERYPRTKTVYTGPIDEFFDFRFGRLPYRSLQFRHITLPQVQFQPVGVVNYPDDRPYTRITEFKHLTGQQHAQTSLVYEYPCAEGDPYYPVPQPANARLYELYRGLAEATPNVSFCGRLANYKYFNMDQVVAQALQLSRKLAEEESVAAALSSRRPPIGGLTASLGGRAGVVAAPRTESA